MSLKFRYFAVVVFALIVWATSGDKSQAQTRRGVFGASRVSLATLTPVQEELKLNDDQKKLADELHDQLVEDRGEVIQNRTGDWDGIRKDMEKLDADATATFTAKLDDGQKQRLTEIYVQANGPNALADSAVIEILKLTDEQKEKLEEIRQANRDDFLDAWQDFQSMSNEERRETMTKLREDADARLLAALNDEQRDAFAKLPGEEVDYDLTEIRGGFPGGGGGRQGGGGNRPQRPQ